MENFAAILGKFLKIIKGNIKRIFFIMFQP